MTDSTMNFENLERIIADFEESSRSNKDISKIVKKARKIDDTHFFFQGQVGEVVYGEACGLQIPRGFELYDESSNFIYFKCDYLDHIDRAAIRESEKLAVIAEYEDDEFMAVAIRKADNNEFDLSREIENLENAYKKHEVKERIEAMLRCSDSELKEFTGRIISKEDNNCYYDFCLKIGSSSFFSKAILGGPFESLMYSKFKPGDDVVVRGKRYGRLIVVFELESKIDHALNKKITKEQYMKYLELPDKLKADVRDQLGIERAKDRTIDMNYSQRELKAYYEICKGTYSKEVQKTVESLLKSSAPERTRQSKQMERCAYLLGIHSHYFSEFVTPKELREALDSEFFGMETVKEQIVDLLRTIPLKKGRKGFSILLISKPGAGKTSIALAIAEARKKPYDLIRCVRMTSAVSLTGSESTFGDCQLGALGNAFAKMGTTDGTLILDEIEKSSHSVHNRNGCPDGIYLNLLDGEYEDSYLECPIDCGDSLIIATANKKEDIPEHVRNRFDVTIELPEYSEDEKVHIGQSYIIPNALNDYGADDSSITFDEDVLKHIISYYCFDFGARDLKHAIERIMRKIAALSDFGNDGFSYNVEKEFVDSVLRSKELSDKEIIYKNLSYFTPNDQMTVKETIYNSETTIDEEGNKSRTLKETVKWIADFFNNSSVPSNFNAEEFIRELDKTHSEMWSPKRALCRCFSRFYRTKRGGNLLLLGVPGTGKTTLVKAACEASGLKYQKISLNGVNNADFIKGSLKSFANADPGRLLSKIKLIGKNGVIQLDEIDKMSKNPEVVSALLDLLDEKLFFSPYLDLTLDLSGIVFIATANNLSNVPPELVDRFELCKVSAYKKDEQKNIFLEHVLPNTIKESMITSKITFSDEAIDYLINKHTTEGGARNLTRNTENILEDAINKYTDDDNIVISVDDVIDSLGECKDASKKIGF